MFEREDPKVYFGQYQHKNGATSFIADHEEAGGKIFIPSEQCAKILENPEELIQIRKPSAESKYGPGKTHQLAAYFEEESCLVIYSGRNVNEYIEDLTKDLASKNGELEISIDVDHMWALIDGVKAHEFAQEVAKVRARERTDYLASKIIRPTGKFFKPNKKENKD